MTDVIDLSAQQLVTAIRHGTLTAADALDAVAARRALVEPVVNAVPIDALARARKRRRVQVGRLGGVPIVVKDVVDVAGLPTTHGSPAFGTAVARRTDPVVRRIERHGALVVGKTNVPELNAGADTVNPVFGRTRNPWNPALSCGASSGGAAVAVATGTAWCAHAEDTAGSIRIPAAFCGVVGLRPTPGLVSATPPGDPVPGLSVYGPIARTVADAHLFLTALLAARPRAASLRETGRPRIAFSPHLGGLVPTDPEIAAICTDAAKGLEGAGFRVDVAAPVVSGAHEACLTLLAHRAAVLHGETVDRHPGIGPAPRGEVEAGRRLPAERVAAAFRARADLGRRMADFFATYQLLVVPTAGRAPWAVADDLSPYPAAPEDLASIAALWPLATLAPMAGCPALSVPCGLTAAGLPVGLQLIGAPYTDFAVLAAGRVVEQTRPDGPVLPVGVS